MHIDAETYTILKSELGAAHVATMLKARTRPRFSGDVQCTADAEVHLLLGRDLTAPNGATPRFDSRSRRGQVAETCAAIRVHERLQALTHRRYDVAVRAHRVDQRFDAIMSATRKAVKLNPRAWHELRTDSLFAALLTARVRLDRAGASPETEDALALHDRLAAAAEREQKRAAEDQRIGREVEAEERRQAQKHDAEQLAFVLADARELGLDRRQTRDLARSRGVLLPPDPPADDDDESGA